MSEEDREDDEKDTSHSSMQTGKDGWVEAFFFFFFFFWTASGFVGFILC